MSKSSIVNSNIYAYSYAKAVFAAAVVKYDNAQEWTAALTVLTLIAQRQEMQILCTAPQFTFKQRLDAVLAIYAAAQITLSSTAFNFVQLLLTNRHLMLAPHIAHNYQEMLNKHRNILKASVVSAQDLPSVTKQELMAQLATRYPCQIEMQHCVQPELIGGVILNIDGKVIDASVRGQLRRLHNFLCE